MTSASASASSRKCRPSWSPNDHRCVRPSRTYSCSMPVIRPLRRIGLLVATAAAVVGLTACSPDSPTTQDAYKIGCPAVDTALAGGSVANQAAIKGLEALRDSGQLDPQPTEWVDA